MTAHKPQQSIEDYKSQGDYLNKSLISRNKSELGIANQSSKAEVSMQGLDEYQDNPKLNETLQEPSFNERLGDSGEKMHTSSEVNKSSIEALSEKVTKAIIVEKALPLKIMLD